MANDMDNKRCYLLVRQTLKRLQSPCCMVMNQDAAYLPNMKMSTVNDLVSDTITMSLLSALSIVEKAIRLFFLFQTIDGVNNETVLKYDRILCDVVCSGDGTMRKNMHLWTIWSPATALGLHPLQYNIAKRGVELLKAGGLLVYSTCSLNPIENEAVVCQLLRYGEGSLSLVDVSMQLPTLKRRPGLTKWKVMDRSGNLYESFDDVPVTTKGKLLATMFPPTELEASAFNLHHWFVTIAFLVPSNACKVGYCF